MKPSFFAVPAEFRLWLETHHETAAGLWVGFYKKGSGRPSMTWPQSVDEALCFGWIDAVRKGIDQESYMIRFTRRKPGSIWSAVNIARVDELIRTGRMQSAGLDAFGRRQEKKSRIYAYEQKEAAALDEKSEADFRQCIKGWEFFLAQPPSYRQLTIWGVISAKKEETRKKRLAALIEASEAGRRL
ncbi:MAG: bacteriocin-protection protein YdeI/OmpD-associated family [Chthoniobacteraceae bacterium]|nr:bacteriocin-protection protein YdeI/OmpD-associated family [Chthoniobacteraceae bacterium]